MLNASCKVTKAAIVAAFAALAVSQTASAQTAPDPTAISCQTLYQYCEGWAAKNGTSAQHLHTWQRPSTATWSGNGSEPLSEHVSTALSCHAQYRIARETGMWPAVGPAPTRPCQP